MTLQANLNAASLPLLRCRTLFHAATSAMPAAAVKAWALERLNAMLLQLTHETRYTYTPAVENADHVLHLSPPSNAAQTVLEHRLDISPQPTHLLGRQLL